MTTDCRRRLTPEISLCHFVAFCCFSISTLFGPTRACYAAKKDDDKSRPVVSVTPRVFGKLISTNAVVRVQLEGRGDHDVEELWFECLVDKRDLRKENIRFKPTVRMPFKEIVEFQVEALEASPGSTITMRVAFQHNVAQKIGRSKSIVLRIVSQAELVGEFHKHVTDSANQLQPVIAKTRESNRKLAKANALAKDQQMVSVIQPLVRELHSQFLSRQKQLETVAVKLALLSQSLEDNRFDPDMQKRLKKTLASMINVADDVMPAICRDLEEAQSFKDAARILAVTKRIEKTSIQLAQRADDTLNDLREVASYLELVQMVQQLIEEQDQLLKKQERNIVLPRGTGQQRNKKQVDKTRVRPVDGALRH